MKMKSPHLFKTQPAAGKNMSIVGSTFSHENEVITLFYECLFWSVCDWLTILFFASSQSTVLHYHQILQIDCVKMCEDTINGSTLIYLQIQLFEICASSVLAEVWRTIARIHLICHNISLHYGKKSRVSIFLNFPLWSPSQVAPKNFCLVEQCRTKIPPGIEAYSI